MTTVPTDLHGHTLFSDGRATPEEYVQFRAERGYQVIAVSDHDLFGAVPRAAKAAREAGVVLVPAMEVTSFIKFGTEAAEQIHILAYFPPSSLEDGSLERTFLYQRNLKVRARWRQFVLDWVKKLSPYDRDMLDGDNELPELPEETFPALQCTINRIAQRNPLAYDPFRRHHIGFWEKDAELFGWTPEEAIETVRADGALDIVAHPVRVRDKARMDRVLDYASGLEVYTSRHKADIAARFRAYADENGKHWTASSDDHEHGRYIAPPSGTPVRTVERMGVSVTASMLSPDAGANASHARAS